MPDDTARSAAPATGYRPWLDGVRGVAVLLVLADHIGSVGGATWFPVGMGETGVGLFFGLSGYLITGLLLDERAATGRVRYGAFYLRRAARLLPALLLMLGVSCVAYRHLGYPEVLRDAGYVLLYVANYRTIATGQYLLAFGQTWSLAVEEHFYLLWPVALGLLSRRRGPKSVIRWALLGCAAALVWRSVLVLGKFGPELLPYHGSLERVDALLYGCAAALAVRSGWRPGRWLGLAAVMAMAVVVVVGDQSVPGATVVQAVTGAASAALVAHLDQWPSRLRRALSWRPVAWVGVVSYGIYLWHWALLIGVFYADHFHRSIVVSALVGLVLTPVVAAVSYYGLELPVRTRVRRWLSRRAEAPVGSPGPGAAPATTEPR